MEKGTLNKSHATRTGWYLKFLGSEKDLSVYDRIMEDDETRLGIFEFKPSETNGIKRGFWTYVTNGMSERRMPCKNKPHGEPDVRVELLAYSSDEARWIADLLTQAAKFPFLHGSGFASSQTIPVNHQNYPMWNGYIFSYPPVENEKFSPLGFNLESNSDMVVFLQLIGLKKKMSLILPLKMVKKNI